MASEYKKKEKKRFRITAALSIAAVLLVLFFMFLILFRVNTVEITGNYHYTDKQIEQYVLKGPLSNNTVLLSLMHKHTKIQEADFIDSVAVDMTGMNSVRIQVSEKKLIGYVSYDNAYWYFDQDGCVLVRSDTPEGGDSAAAASDASGTDTSDTASSDASFPAASVSSEAESVTSISGNSVMTAPSDLSSDSSTVTGSDAASYESASVIAPQETDSEGTVVLTPQEVTTDSKDDVSSDSNNDESYASNSKKTDASSGSGVKKAETSKTDYIPLVDGLHFTEATVGEILPVPDTGVFAMIESVKNIVKNQDEKPDLVTFADDGTLSLTYGDAVVMLGGDDHLETKLNQLTGILPKLEGMSGTLHLENYDGTQNRIIFEIGRAHV